MFGTLVSDLQENVTVVDGVISGTLKYYDEETAPLVQSFGPGNFMALKFDSDAPIVEVGLVPSQGSGFVRLDSDMNGVFKVTSKDQKFVVKTNGDGEPQEFKFKLTGLTLEEEAEVVG